MTILAALARGPKRYRGGGINHEGESFRGDLLVQPLMEGMAVMLHYSAKLASGEQVHADCTLLAPSMDGTLTLWPLMSELPGILPHKVIESSEALAVFSSGSRSDRAVFRQEITIRIEAGGSLQYSHAWGLPGEDFAERSSCFLAPRE